MGRGAVSRRVISIVSDMAHNEDSIGRKLETLVYLSEQKTARAKPGMRLARAIVFRRSGVADQVLEDILNNLIALADM